MRIKKSFDIEGEWQRFLIAVDLNHLSPTEDQIVERKKAFIAGMSCAFGIMTNTIGDIEDEEEGAIAVGEFREQINNAAHQIIAAQADRITKN